MYILLCGEPPFAGETEDEIFDKIKKCDYNFSPKEFNYVSDNCKNLIQQLTFLQAKSGKANIIFRVRIDFSFMWSK